MQIPNNGNNPSEIKGLVVAAPASSSGKTTFTLGLLAALAKRGLRVAPFKVGPDFIDPGHHTRIAGRTSRNLDGWMLGRNQNREIFFQGAFGADIAVVEGVMGLFDGFDGRSDAGSTAQIAKWLGLPVILVVNAGAMARSFAALVRGFCVFDPDLHICGVVANNVGSPRHFEYLAQAMEKEAVPLLGGVFRNSRLEIPGRHLGLYTTEDHGLSDDIVDILAESVENAIDMDALFYRLPDIPVGRPDAATIPDPDVRIGVARDNAFCFYYEDNLDVLRENGAEIVFFSPLNDPAPPPDIQGLYLGGGYPELFAETLSGNDAMKQHIRRLCDAGMPVYAECGGFMYLCRNLLTSQDGKHEMAGVFPFDTRMQDKRFSLGYREIRFIDDTPIAATGMSARGHEFHYSRLIDDAPRPPEIRQVYEAADKSDQGRSSPGWVVKQTLGSYVHLHFRSCPAIGEYFADACRNFKIDSLVKSHSQTTL